MPTGRSSRRARSGGGPAATHRSPAMQHLDTITEDEMVSHFLRTELHSVRFEEALLTLLARDGMDRRVIDEPDLGSPEENAYRLRLLAEYRGYRCGEGIFKFIPGDVAWHRFAISR